MLPFWSKYRNLDIKPCARKIPFLSIAGEYDVLAPPAQCHHPEATNIVVPSDHAGLLFRPEVFERTHTFLTDGVSVERKVHEHP